MAHLAKYLNTLFFSQELSTNFPESHLTLLNNDIILVHNECS